MHDRAISFKLTLKTDKCNITATAVNYTGSYQFFDLSVFRKAENGQVCGLIGRVSPIIVDSSNAKENFPERVLGQFGSA